MDVDVQGAFELGAGAGHPGGVRVVGVLGPES